MTALMTVDSYNVRIKTETPEGINVTFEKNLTQEEMNDLKEALESEIFLPEDSPNFALAKWIGEILLEIPQGQALRTESIIDKIHKKFSKKQRKRIDRNCGQGLTNRIYSVLNTYHELGLLEYYFKYKRESKDFVELTRIGRIALKARFENPEEN